MSALASMNSLGVAEGVVVSVGTHESDISSACLSDPIRMSENAPAVIYVAVPDARFGSDGACLLPFGEASSRGCESPGEGCVVAEVKIA